MGWVLYKLTSEVDIMLNGKEDFIRYLNSVKKSNIKIINDFTKDDLINAINEATSSNRVDDIRDANLTEEDNADSEKDTKSEDIPSSSTKQSSIDDNKSEDRELSSSEEAIPDVAAMDAGTKPGQLYNIKAPKEKTISSTRRSQVSSNTTQVSKANEEKRKETAIKENGRVLWDTKAGYPRIVMNDVFPYHMGMFDYGKLKTVLSKDAIKTIASAKPNDWVPVSRRSIICDQNELNNATKGTVRCFPVDNKMLNEANEDQSVATEKAKTKRAVVIPTAFIREYYTVKKMDSEGKSGSVILEPKSQNEKIALLKIPSKSRTAEYAIKMENLTSTNPYLMVRPSNITNFLYKASLD
jgi:hypothetical protein